MRYTKTETGQQAFKERSPIFSARQRAAFILFDGNKTLDQVLASTVGMGVNAADIDHMVDQGFLAAVAGQTSPPVVTQVVTAAVLEAGTPPSDRTAQQRYADAKPIATKLTAALGLRGFRLNLAVESAAGFDDLVALLPKIQDAVGPKLAHELELALKG